MAQHEPRRMANMTFEEFVSRDDGMAADTFGVPQCAFVATRSGVSACAHPADEADRLTRLFVYSADFEQNGELLSFLREYYPAIAFKHYNRIDGASSTGLGLRSQVSPEARRAITERYAADMQLYQSLLTPGAARAPVASVAQSAPAPARATAESSERRALQPQL
eukprot:3378620-Prymnesium_polylepis.1